MNNSGKKPVIGIIGGVCSGKSTVAAEFAKLGCKVIDADKIVHELLDNPAVKDKIVLCFGEEILDSADKIDRRRLGDYVFGDGDRLSTLNEITHPLVLARTQELIDEYDGQEHVKGIVLDMPLLIEVGWNKRCDSVIFVDCDEEIRALRAQKKGIFEDSQIKIRENFQISLDSKAEIADNVIVNNSDFSVLATKVVEVFSCIVGCS